MIPILFERYKCGICDHMMYLRYKEIPNPKCEECDSIDVGYEGVGPEENAYQRVIDFHRLNN